MTEREIFEEAQEIASPEARDAFLRGACGHDAEIRHRLDALLREHFADDSLLDTDALVGARATIKAGLAEAPAEALPPMVGRYKLLEKLGEGGFGEVWMAEQREPVKRRVALKVIKLGMDSKQVVARFEAERQALAMMDHPNIAKILDAGVIEGLGEGRGTRVEGRDLPPGRPYFVMELVRGVKITEYCDHAQMPTEERLKLFIQVCQAIQHAHQKGIIHRDIKPSNILVTLHDGVPVPKVIDFGIAKATQQELTDKTVFTQFQQFIGTPAYISPEQAEMSGLDIDTRADIYSLGVLLYELLVGQTPFDAKEMMKGGLDALRQIIREREPQRPSTKLNTLPGEQRTTAGKRRQTEIGTLVHQLKGDLDWIVMKCLEKDRARRYETANGLAADLKRHLNNEPVVARPASAAYRFQKLVRRNKAATAGVASVVLALSLGLGLATAALVRERAARQRELAQSIRADSVATFIDSLVTDALPSLMRQGNVRGVRELIDKADALASSSLTNAPAAELNLRFKLGRALLETVSDAKAAWQQMEAITRQLPNVAADQLNVPRDQLRVYISSTRLWAAGGEVPLQEKAMKELESLDAEFMARTPPDLSLAGQCRFSQGFWFRRVGKLEQAEAACAEACELLPRDRLVVIAGSSAAAEYVQVLSERGKLARAEQVARENLQTPSDKGQDARDGYLSLLGAFGNVLCLQDRFAEASGMLEERRRLLAAGGGSEWELVRVDALRGAVLARSGNARDALPILEAVASNRFSSVLDWRFAATIAAAAGDHEAYQRLCRIGLLRFASSVEGGFAASVAVGLYLQVTDDTTLAMVRAMVDRAARATEGTAEYNDIFRAIVAYREHHYPEALVLLDQFRAAHMTQPQSMVDSRVPGQLATVSYLRAMLCAELERAVEARRDFAEASEQLHLALGDKPGHDRGSYWHLAYQAEIRQREAIEVFKAKGIPLTEPAAK